MGKCAKTAAAVLHAERPRKLGQFTEQLQRYWPEAVYGGADGAIPPELLAASKEAGTTKRRRVESPFLDKNATPADALVGVEEVFDSVRPTAVVEERSSKQLAAVDATYEKALGETAKLTVWTEPLLEPQFNSEYQSRAFPRALKYRAGGADFPQFASSIAEEGERWRRGREAPPLTPQRNAKNLARRV